MQTSAVPSSQSDVRQDWYDTRITRYPGAFFRTQTARRTILVASVAAGMLEAVVAQADAWLLAAVLMAVFGVGILAAIAPWTWAWQRASLVIWRGNRAKLAAIVGGPPTMAALEQWLSQTPDASIESRIVVLVALGRLNAAAELVDQVPSGTPEDRYVRAFCDAARDAGAAGPLDLYEARQAMAELPPGEHQRRAKLALDYWQGVGHLNGGARLRDVPAPRVHVSRYDEAALWRRFRVEPIVGFAAALALTWLAIWLLTESAPR